MSVGSSHRSIRGRARCRPTPDPTRTGRQAAGFTLLELLVVIVLAGILLSIVTITVRPDERQSLATEGERVARLFALAADEARMRQRRIVWEADLRGYRFAIDEPGQRETLNDDLLRERTWERPLTRLALIDPGAAPPEQILLTAGAAPVRAPIAREWVRARWRIELARDAAQVAIEFDETGRSHVVPR